MLDVVYVRLLLFAFSMGWQLQTTVQGCEYTYVKSKLLSQSL